MAKKSVVNRNRRRQRMVDAAQEKRVEIKKKWLNLNNSPEVRQAAFNQLLRMPRDTSPVRLRIRCELTGRPRGVFRRFGLSRSKLRDMVLNGEIPGVVKSSW